MPGAVSPEGTSGAPGAPEAPTHAAPRRLESSFSVEALLARPGPRARTAGLWSSALCAPAPVLPWPGPETWLPPACLGPTLHQPGASIPVLALRLAPFCGLRSLGVTGLELVHCPGFWSPPHRAPAQDFQDIDRPPKRVRTMFNLEQLEELEKVFAKQHNLVGEKRAQLAARLNLTENQVRVWFQNRRVKYQKQQRLKQPAESAMSASPDEPSSTSTQRDEADSGVDS
ncbi:homeobox protein notochord [Suncus etruscus]|uniref:homeobox protein notochord n=1 Tax=Suncus etruscus TaxID=109475 RepID=UPI0021102F81|nr:homeobox protein notochord [Suncus etruscus]